jgi:hypothetical protein
VEYYESEYRRQYCRERIAQAREEYRRAQAPPKESRRRERIAIAWIRSIWARSRSAAQRPAYRS